MLMQQFDRGIGRKQCLRFQQLMIIYWGTKIINKETEIIEKNEKYNYEIYATKHILHVLPPIYPDSNKSVKENSIEMMQKDYEQKKNAYEKAYNKKLDYTFEETDIVTYFSLKKIDMIESLKSIE